MKISIPLALGIVVALSGCASQFPVMDKDPNMSDEKEYITGSMLPQRNNGNKVEKLTAEQVEEFQRSANAARGTLPTNK